MSLAPITATFALNSFGILPSDTEREKNRYCPSGVSLLSRSHSAFFLQSSTPIQRKGITVVGMSLAMSEVGPLSAEVAASGSFGLIYLLGFAQIGLLPFLPELRWYSAPEQKPNIEEPNGSFQLKPRQIVDRFFRERLGSPTPLERAKKSGKEKPFRDCVQRCVAEIREKCAAEVHSFNKASAIEDCSTLCEDFFMREKMPSDPYRYFSAELDRIVSGQYPYS